MTSASPPGAAFPSYELLKDQADAMRAMSDEPQLWESAPHVALTVPSRHDEAGGNEKGIAVRAGSHCAMPLMDFYGINASARASFAMYNTTGDVDALVEALSFCRELFA